jgi:hypothetical protein
LQISTRGNYRQQAQPQSNFVKRSQDRNFKEETFSPCSNSFPGSKFPLHRQRLSISGIKKQQAFIEHAEREMEADKGVFPRGV